MDTITTGTAWATTLGYDGRAEATFTPPAPGKYVFEVSGTPAVVGVYEGTFPLGNRGKLRIEPGAKRGVRTLAAVQHLVVAQAAGPGPFALKIRPWSFWDYFSFG